MNWLYTLVFAGLLFNSGAGSDSPVPNYSFNIFDSGSNRQTVSDESETLERTFPLTAGGRVSISNVNGPIDVEAWERSEVRLVAVKSADSRDALDAVEIRIDSGPDFVTVRADYKNRIWREGESRQKDRVNVSFKLQVPKDAVLDEIGTVNGSITLKGFTNRVRASAVNGSVRGLNLTGAVSLSTVNGEVLADFDRLDGKGRVNLETVNGKIVLLVPSNSDAVVRADTLNGNITNDVGLSIRKNGFIGRNLSGKLGNGGVSVRLTSVNGPISITRKADGKPQSAVSDLPLSQLDRLAAPNQPSSPAAPQEKARKDQEMALIEAKKASAEAAKAALNSANVAAEIEKAIAEKAVEIEKLKDLEIEKSKEIEKIKLNAISPVKVVIPEILAGGPFFAGMPGVQMPNVGRSADTVSAEGVNKIIVDAPECRVRIRGWDKKDISYSLTTISRSKDGGPLKPDATRAGDEFVIRLPEAVKNGEMDTFLGNYCTLDLTVPQKSNIKVNSRSGIRMQDVKGNFDLTSEGGPVDIRDSEGRVSLTSVESLVRLIGFTGDLSAETVNSETYLDGDFNSITAKATDGSSLILSLPSNTGAEITASTTDFCAEDLPSVKKLSSNRWLLGDGKRKYVFEGSDFAVRLRDKERLYAN